MGPSLNSPMNLVTSLATYAAMTRELGLPLRFPGTKEGWNTLQETTDAELFGRATLWALGEDKARNEIFNVSNGDVYRWRQLWKELAAFYDLPIAEPLAMSTASEMSEKAPLWDSLVARYCLHATPYEQIANWAFVDWMLNFREETIQSTIKIRSGRRCGFHRHPPQLSAPAHQTSRPAHHPLELLWTTSNEYPSRSNISAA